MSNRRFLLLIAILATTMAAAAQSPTTLKDAYRGSFYVGAAINAAQITGADVRGDALIKAQFNSISPENVMKWEVIHPRPGVYDFTLADQYVELGLKNHMFIVGHNLVWHSQVPDWVFQDDKGQPLTREALLKRMHDHIFTVVGRYKGRIQSWDVVNEALNDDGTLRQSKWLKIIGDDYILKAFQYAHEADPQAQLNYNDYSLENEPKRKGAIALISDFAKLGVKIAITELDIDVLPSAAMGADVSLSVKADPKLNPYPNALPDAVQKALAEQYATLFGIYLKHRDVMSRVTFWGVTDADSWRNDWPVRGRSDYPLLFDRAGQPKPAFDAVIEEAAKSAQR